MVGELVMDELKDLDEVAYVRFASVYREFKDVNTFMDELKKILDKEKKVRTYKLTISYDGTRYQGGRDRQRQIIQFSIY